MIGILLAILTLLWLLVYREEGPKRATMALMNMMALLILAIFILGTYGNSAVLLLIGLALLVALLG